MYKYTHHRKKAARLKDYDYQKKRVYLITLHSKYHYSFAIKDIREIIANNFLYFQEQGLFNLIIVNILPNHIHFLMHKNNDIHLKEVMRKLKSKISTELIQNNLMPYQKFWQKGYYDRIVREQGELLGYFKYIENNQVKHKYWDKEKDYPGLFHKDDFY